MEYMNNRERQGEREGDGKHTFGIITLKEVGFCVLAHCICKSLPTFLYSHFSWYGSALSGRLMACLVLFGRGGDCKPSVFLVMYSLSPQVRQCIRLCHHFMN